MDQAQSTHGFYGHIEYLSGIKAAYEKKVKLVCTN
jgi:hypothetical protein